VGLERTSQGTTAPTTTQRGEGTSCSATGEVTSDDDEEISAPVIKVEIEAVPEFVDLHLLISASPTAKLALGLRCRRRLSRLMRAFGGAMHMDDPELAENGLKVIHLASTARKWFSHCARKQFVDEALILECSTLNSLSESLPQDSITFRESYC
jgi:hypothetical protein